MPAKARQEGLPALHRTLDVEIVRAKVDEAGTDYLNVAAPFYACRFKVLISALVRILWALPRATFPRPSGIAPKKG